VTFAWFWIASVTLALYVVLDGFDFGAGLLHLFVAKTDAQRRQVLAAIGPFWDGNEVWLLAGGGVLVLAFPRVLAAGLSGFYLAIMMLLWTLVLRGISIELRSHHPDVMWRSFWDGVFFLGSALAPVLLGAALGNLVRGVPIDEHGWFALPLFDSFSPHGALGVLDWYTVLVALVATSLLARHGALFLAWKTDGEVQRRARAVARVLLPITIGAWLVATIATWSVAPDVLRAAAARPSAWVFTAGALIGLVLSSVGGPRTAFLGSGGLVLGLLAAIAASLYPVMLKATVPSRSVEAGAASSSAASLHAAAWWWPVAFLLAAGYFALLHWLHRGPRAAEDERQAHP